jgi:hypothetical protein
MGGEEWIYLLYIKNIFENLYIGKSIMKKLQEKRRNRRIRCERIIKIINGLIALHIKLCLKIL